MFHISLSETPMFLMSCMASTPVGQTKTWIAHNSLSSAGIWRWLFAHLSLLCAPAMQQYNKLKNEKSEGVGGEGVGSWGEESARRIEGVKGKWKWEERRHVEIILITKCLLKCQQENFLENQVSDQGLHKSVPSLMERLLFFKVLTLHVFNIRSQSQQNSNKTKN